MSVFSLANPSFRNGQALCSQNFVFDEATKAGLSFTGPMELCFMSVKSGQPLVYRQTPEASNNCTIWCDDMETVSEIVQDLCAKLGVRGVHREFVCSAMSSPMLLSSLLHCQILELESQADFPAEMEKFREVLMKVRCKGSVV